MCWSYVVCLRTRLLGVWPLVEAAPVLSALFVGGCSWSSACLLSALGVASPPSNSLFMASAGSVFKKAYFVARRCAILGPSFSALPETRFSFGRRIRRHTSTVAVAMASEARQRRGGAALPVKSATGFYAVEYDPAEPSARGHGGMVSYQARHSASPQQPQQFI